MNFEQFTSNGGCDSQPNEEANLLANVQAEVDALGLGSLLEENDNSHLGVPNGGPEVEMPGEAGEMTPAQGGNHLGEGDQEGDGRHMDRPNQVAPPEDQGNGPQVGRPGNREQRGKRIERTIRNVNKKRKAYGETDGGNPGGQGGALRRREENTPWSLYNTDPRLNASLREQIEAKLRVKLMPKPPQPELSFERPTCCFAKLKNRHLLHTRTCCDAKEQIWVGNAEEACPVGYLTLLNDDPERALKPWTKTHTALFNLCLEIKAVTKSYVVSGERIWKAYSLNQCGQFCFRKEVLEMSSCVAMMMRAGAQAANYHQLAQLHRVWLEHEDLGKDFVSRLHACSRRGQDLQIHCGLPNFSQSCVTQRLRREIASLQRQALVTEQSLKKKCEDLMNEGLPHLQCSILNSLMHGLSQNQARFEQLYWLLMRRRVVLKFPDLSTITLQGGEDKDSYLPAVSHGFAKVPSLEATLEEVEPEGSSGSDLSGSGQEDGANDGFPALGEGQPEDFHNWNGDVHPERSPRGPDLREKLTRRGI